MPLFIVENWTIFSKKNLLRVLDQTIYLAFKVETMLKGSLDLVLSPSPSVKIQIISRKVCFRCKGKTLLGDVNKILKQKGLLIIPSNVLPQVNFPANNLNFH